MVLVRPGSNRLDPLVLGTDYLQMLSSGSAKGLCRRQQCRAIASKSFG